jgi:4-hydroxy-3-polyprenylbenzoate decarboxylase
MYKSLAECLLDLERHGHLIRVREEIDPELEMAALHLRVFSEGGPALLFENVKGSRFKAVSNLFGTLERSKFMFRDTFEKMQQLVQLRNDPGAALKRPFKNAAVALSALSALPRKRSFSSGGFHEIMITDLPLIKHWPQDGGAFITLPQVYTEDIDKPGLMHANIGMYRIQLNGNDYITNREAGLHYQLHRGIGVHQTKTNSKGLPLKVSIFVGGPPAHTLAAVMPLPEGVSEVTFAGALGKKRFSYCYHQGYCISLDADFVITGEVFPDENKPEGPFGDHLGYYSLKHSFPVMRIHKVYAKQNAIWPFTVVGRPPQEDTAFGALIHELSGSAIPYEIPGVKKVHAVDEAGVHPLLLVNGSERYTPYMKSKRPAEILTQANRILGTGQLSLAKFLFITAGENAPDCHDVKNYLQFVFERCDFSRDIHFHTRTTIDTLDYSGEDLNEGSKVVIAACGEKLRDLFHDDPSSLADHSLIFNADLIMPGVLMLRTLSFTGVANAAVEIKRIAEIIKANLHEWKNIAQVVLYDHFNLSGNKLADYLWITYTRCNPSHDVYGVDEFTEHKHWGCNGPLIFDARKKPQHAPELVKDPKVEERIERFFQKGGSLYRGRS